MAPVDCVGVDCVVGWIVLESNRVLRLVALWLEIVQIEVVDGEQFVDFALSDCDAAGRIEDCGVIGSPDLTKPCEVFRVGLVLDCSGNWIGAARPDVNGELLEPLADIRRLGFVVSPTARGIGKGLEVFLS